MNRIEYLIGVVGIFVELLLVVPHPNHVTLTEIEFNNATGNFEVSFCVWPDDLEAVLKKIHDKQFPKQEFRMQDETVATLFPQYLAKQFRIASSEASEKTQVPIRWVGSELGEKKAWLYFEIQTDSAENSYTLKNTVFFELNDDQINHVKYKHGTRLSWHQLTDLDATATFSTSVE